ncbi:c-type cytochrome domain-containing protein [Fimbriiglobus ruber]|uniref:High-affnity carbon uptake protein Hat/HatR n=1 Tax=Fimbriiglobus ruber TaxID=1908690 RepID=A0A225DNT2_9BACT|nr:c-type cytochrome domain-containing protein [Fimbriiglobus ruber]OWK43120.1 High-affnity carbon uptake protein Hat/HatR [Fimbriiglobus ruber]
MTGRVIALVVFASVLSVSRVNAAELPSAGTSAKVSYYKDVRPILQQHCLGCHQPAKAGGLYVMTAFANLLKTGESGKPAVVAGKPEASFLLHEIQLKDGKAEMPKGRPPLKQLEIDLVAKWIKEGAADDTPASARAVVVDAKNPPQYSAPPVVTALAFSPDGRFLAVSGYHEVLLFAADGSHLISRLIGASERVQSLAFSPDGNRLAVAGGAPGRFGEIQIWTHDKDKLLVSTTVTFDTLYGVSWSPDGKVVGFGCSDNTVRAIDAATGAQVLQMGTHSDWIVGTTFSRDGLHLASVSRDMTMKLTEVPTQRFVDNVTSITPGALKGGLMAIDCRPFEEAKKAKIPTDTPNAAPKEYDELIAAGSDGTPRLYKMHREVPRVIGDDANRIKEYEALPGRVSCVRFDAEGDRFAAASSLDGKGEVRVYDVASGKKVVCEQVTGPAYVVAWSPTGKVVASAGFDGRIWLHDPATGKLLHSFVALPAEKISARQ